MSLVRRVAKFGFSNEFHATKYHTINVCALEKAFADGETVTLEALQAKGLCKGKSDGLKVLGTGDLKKKLKVVAREFSASAEEKIAAAGGTVERLAK